MSTKLSTILPCTPANAAAEAGCAGMFITTFGAKAYRRPLTAAEIDDAEHPLPDRARDAGARLQRLDRAAARGDAAGARLHLPLGDGSGPGDQGGRGRAARQLSDRQPPLVFPVGHDARHRRCSRRPRAGELSTADGIGTQVTRMLADTKAQSFVADFIEDWLDVNVLASRPKDAKLYAMWNQDLASAMETEFRTFGTTRGPGQRVVRRSADGQPVVGEPGARDGLRRQRRHRHHAQGGHVRREPARRHPDAGRLPGRHRRERRVVAGAARARDLHAHPVRRASRPARQRAAAGAADAGADDAPALRDARHERLHRRLPRGDGSDRLRLRALRRHRRLPDHGPEPAGRFERLDHARRQDADVHGCGGAGEAARREPGGAGLLRQADDPLRAQPLGHGRRRRVDRVGGDRGSRAPSTCAT